jgi:hypothetical protein
MTAPQAGPKAAPSNVPTSGRFMIHFEGLGPLERA